jgi:hypothetical protein
VIGESALPAVFLLCVFFSVAFFYGSTGGKEIENDFTRLCTDELRSVYVWFVCVWLLHGVGR